MLTSAPQGAVERHRRYWTTTVRMCEDFYCAILIDQMRFANEISVYLPCMKHAEDSPVLWPTMNVPFSEMEMCIHVINALPMNLAAVYWASKGIHFPVSLKALNEDLWLVEAQVNHTTKAMDELRKNAGLPPKNHGSKGICTTKMANGDRIPRKQS